jgi:hypothetical protein
MNEGPPPEEEDFSQIPLVERSQHKVRNRSALHYLRETQILYSSSLAQGAC